MAEKLDPVNVQVKLSIIVSAFLKSSLIQEQDNPAIDPGDLNVILNDILNVILNVILNAKINGTWLEVIQ